MRTLFALAITLLPRHRRSRKPRGSAVHFPSLCPTTLRALTAASSAMCDASIVRGETAVSQYACGSCVSSWTVSDGGERREGPAERRRVR